MYYFLIYLCLYWLINIYDTSSKVHVNSLWAGVFFHLFTVVSLESVVVPDNSRLLITSWISYFMIQALRVPVADIMDKVAARQFVIQFAKRVFIQH